MYLARATSRWLPLAAALLVAACRTTAPPAIERMPDPLRPPVAGSALTEAQHAAVRAAVGYAERGEMAAARSQLATLPAAHPVVGLAELELRFLAGEDVARDSRALAAENEGYAAAWAVAALAAEKAGDVQAALDAAQRVAALWHDPGWETRVGELRRTVVAGAISEIRALLARGDASAALERATSLLSRSPDEVPARVLAVRAAIAAGRAQEAASLVPALPDTPEGLELKGRVAEALGQWELAADLYSRLPANHPGRCELLSGAREQVREVNAPPAVTRALEGGTLTRRGLASILVWEEPKLRELASGPVTVFEDIVQVGERGDIVTVTRAGVMTGDALARRFAPERAVSSRELVNTLERLARVLGRPAPSWCQSAADGGCLPVPEQVSGKTAAELVRAVAGQGGNPCTPR